MTAPAFQPVALSGADAAGVLYSDGARHLRGIHAGREAEVRALLQSGLPGLLHARGLFPATWIVAEGVPAPLAGYPLVLEHESIAPVSYPREWSFGMVQSAALAFLEVVELAAAHGYAPTDAHLFNFMFRGLRPLWVDLGSLAPLEGLAAPLPWQAEFNGGILAPLRMWAAGAPFLARSAVRHPASHFTLEEFLAWRHPVLRGSSSFASRLRWLLAAMGNAGSIRQSSGRARLFKALFARSRGAVVRRLRRTIERLRGPRHSAWGGYHDEYLDAGGTPRLPGRFERILELLAQHRPAAVLELAGNAGVLCEALARRNPGLPVTCTDFDPVAIDLLYQRAHGAGLGNLSAAVLDFMVPESTPAEIAPEHRFAADCVLALAVTHHLLLSQGYDFDAVLGRIGAYTKRLAFVEFMPLGLHDGVSAPPLPGWYTQDAFARAFARHFEPLHTEQLDENRVLFVGRRASAQA